MADDQHRWSWSWAGLAFVSAAVLVFSVLIAGAGRARADGPVDYTTMDESDAKAIFGTGSRNGDGSLNAFTVQADARSGLLWAPVFTDQSEARRVSGPVRVKARTASAAVQKSATDDVAVVFSRYSSVQVNDALALLQRKAENESLAVAFSYSPIVDAIAVQADKASAQKLPRSIGGVDLVVENQNVAATVENTAYKSPFSGGMAVYGTPRGGKDSEIARCTLGIPAKNAKGTPGIFTAGHCFKLGVHTWTAESRAGEFNSGKVTHAYTAPGVDAQFISGKSYQPAILTGVGRGSGKIIKGTYTPAAGKGNRVCYNGSTTPGQECGNAVAQYGMTVCYADFGCTKVMRLSGGKVVQPGDSGGPVYANFGTTVKVTGLISGHAGNDTLVVDWRDISSSYSAKVMTG